MAFLRTYFTHCSIVQAKIRNLIFVEPVMLSVDSVINSISSLDGTGLTVCGWSRAFVVSVLAEDRDNKVLV